MQDGVSIVGFVDAGKFQYYKYNLLANANITFTVTVLSGDPDIFISTKYPQPGWGYSDWQSTTPGDEVIFVGSADPGYLGAGNTYYIGIQAYGNLNASYLLLAKAVSRAGQAANELVHD